MASIGRRASALSLVLAVFVLAGCAVERREVPGLGVQRPAWTKRPMELIGGQRVFVGIALADNVLDEANARHRALQDAAHTMLRTVAMDIQQEFKATERRQGAQYKPGGAVDAQLHDEIRARVGGVVENMRPVDNYWERWFVRERTFGPSVRRYKYYVLAEYGEEEYQAVAEEIKAKVCVTE